MPKLTTTATLTAGELLAALSQVPNYTPIKCHVTVEANLHSTDGDSATFVGTARLTGVHTELGSVVLGVEE